MGRKHCFVFDGLSKNLPDSRASKHKAHSYAFVICLQREHLLVFKHFPNAMAKIIKKNEIALPSPSFFLQIKALCEVKKITCITFILL